MSTNITFLRCSIATYLATKWLETYVSVDMISNVYAPSIIEITMWKETIPETISFLHRNVIQQSVFLNMIVDVLRKKNTLSSQFIKCVRYLSIIGINTRELRIFLFKMFPPQMSHDITPLCTSISTQSAKVWFQSRMYQRVVSYAIFLEISVVTSRVDAHPNSAFGQIPSFHPNFFV